MDTAYRKLRDLLAFWHKQRGIRPFPTRRDLSVHLLRPWIGNLALIDILDGGEACFRLCGTNLHARFGGEFTRRSMTALDAAIGASLRDGIERVRKSGAPTELSHERVIDGRRTSFREICLPLSEDAVRVDAVLFASYPAGMK